MKGLRLLAGHFFGRFFDNDIVAQESDMRTDMVQALGLIATPGMLLSFYILPQAARYDRLLEGNWTLVGDYYFFVLYSMVVMGFVMVFEWDSLFPDRKDYLILAPLPLSATTFFLAKIAALLIFLGLFVVDANFFSTVLGPLVSGGSGTSWAILGRLAAVHAIAVSSAGLFVAMTFAGVQGILINLLTARAFRRISPWVQMACMGLVIALLFLTPLACAALRPSFEGASPVLRWFPPFWFLALYVDLLPGRPGGAMFHELAPLAKNALAISAAVFAVSYLAGYRRHTRRVLESLETSGASPGHFRAWFEGTVDRLILPHPLERATFHFISNTILRGARHRLFLASYAGLAAALVFLCVARVRPQPPILGFAPGGLLLVPLILSFLAVTGLRAVFNLPAELRANWIFQVAESEERFRHNRAVRKWLTVMGIAPLCAILLPAQIWFRGWRIGMIHVGVALLLSLVLMNLLLVWFRKIPFTCSYFPGKMAMAVTALVYFLAFTAYCITMARWETAMIAAPWKLIVFAAGGACVLYGLSWLERREFTIDDVLIYEDQPDPAVRTLELG